MLKQTRQSQRLKIVTGLFLILSLEAEEWRAKHRMTLSRLEVARCAATILENMENDSWII